MQMIDMGIALCYFDLATKECDLDIEFVQEAPELMTDDMEYIASYRII